MTDNKHTSEKDPDSPALDGLLRQLSREETDADTAFVERIMGAVKEADEDLNPPVLVIPGR